MAFLFSAQPDHFDDSDESHYYLLWRINDLSSRVEVRDEIKNAYKVKFGKNISGYKQ
jgi:hypothetical protein